MDERIFEGTDVGWKDDWIYKRRDGWRVRWMSVI